RRIRIHSKKQSVYNQGDEPFFRMYVMEGKLRAYFYHDDGREFISNVYKKGEFFGHEFVFTKEPYNHSVETFEEAKIAQIARDDFLELLHKNLSVTRTFLQIMSREIIYKNQQLVGLAYDSVRKKVANALVCVAKKDINTSNTDTCLIRISRDNLSALAGTANETISRMLSDFIDERLISKEVNAIRIYSIKKLKEIKQ